MRTQRHNSCSARHVKKQRTQFLLSEFQNQDQSTSRFRLASSLLDEDQMLQPCRAGPQLSIDPPLSSGNKKYIIPPPTKGYTAPKSAVHFNRPAVTGWPRRARSYADRAQGCASCDNSPFCEDCTRVCPRRPELQESLSNVHKTPMAADLYRHAGVHQDLAIPPH